MKSVRKCETTLRLALSNSQAAFLGVYSGDLYLTNHSNLLNSARCSFSLLFESILWTVHLASSEILQRSLETRNAVTDYDQYYGIRRPRTTFAER